MTISFVAVGSGSGGTQTAMTVPYPAGLAAGDLLVLYIGSHPETVIATTPAGWLSPTGTSTLTGGTGSFASGTGPVRGTVFYKVADGTESGSLSVTLSNQSGSQQTFARIALFRSTISGTGWALASVAGTDTTTGTPWSVTFPSDPGIVAGDLTTTMAAWPQGVAPTFSAESVTATGATLSGAFIANPVNATANQAGGRLAYQNCTAGPATGNATHTFTVSGTTTGTAGVGILTRVREVAAAGAAFSGWGVPL